MRAILLLMASTKSIDFYPFAYALYNEYLDTNCWYCLGDKQKLKICEGCRTAWFCGESCINLGWKDHQIECQALKNFESIPNIEIRLLGRIITRHRDIELENDKKDPNFYLNRKSERKIMDIWAHVEEIRNDAEAMKKFESIYEQLLKFYGNDNLSDKETIFQLHCRDFINRHAISDKSYMTEIGKGLYLDLCAYDHSCAPNTIYICDGMIATLRPLNSGVNLLDKNATFYSYIELLLPKQQRQKLLKDTWYFNCECSRCADNDDHILTSISCPNCTDDEKEIICLFGESSYKEKQTQKITCPKCNNEVTQKQVMDALSGMRFIMDLLEKQELDQMQKKQARKYVQDLKERFKPYLSKYNIYYCKLIEANIRLADPENHEEIVELYLAAEPCVRTSFPENHPALAFHCRNIGLEFYRLEKYDDAIKYLEEAYQMLKFVMPENHSLEKSTKAVLSTIKLKAMFEQNKVNVVTNNQQTPKNDIESSPKTEIKGPENVVVVEENKLNAAVDKKSLEGNILESPELKKEEEKLPNNENVKSNLPEICDKVQTKEEEKKKDEKEEMSLEELGNELVESKIASLEIRKKIAAGFLDTAEDELPELKI
uniref:MYND-type domain-containing protein n=1 Tax=Panagrolaimus superbus TaxID=310955 RepID=A0A914YXV1_9BILA